MTSSALSYAPPVPSKLPQLVVGFDLDMTLINPRRGVRTAMSALAAETGAPIDVEKIAMNLGPPLETALAPWFEGDVLDRACSRYRKLREGILETETDPMPGAIDAIRSVRDRGGKVIVVTAKYEPHAAVELRTVGIEVDDLVGWRYGAEKGATLRSHAAQIYVGDHPADVVAARVGGTVSVVVATGGTSASDLLVSGPDAVLSDLTEFPEWLKEWSAVPRGE